MSRPDARDAATTVAVPVPPGGDDPSLAGLYQELILGHYRRPRHKGVLVDATHTATQKNPLCGDELTVGIQVADGVLVDAGFDARGCSISQATASMLLAHAVGRPVS
nr:iron-sulfur cluster assembly scaffold protein [Gemmatimonadaceae bacterium]